MTPRTTRHADPRVVVAGTEALIGELDDVVGQRGEQACLGEDAGRADLLGQEHVGRGGVALLEQLGAHLGGVPVADLDLDAGVLDELIDQRLDELFVPAAVEHQRLGGLVRRSGGGLRGGVAVGAARGSGEQRERCEDQCERANAAAQVCHGCLSCRSRTRRVSPGPHHDAGRRVACAGAAVGCSCRADPDRRAQAQVDGCDATEGGPRRDLGCPLDAIASTGTVTDPTGRSAPRQWRGAERRPPVRRTPCPAITASVATAANDAEASAWPSRWASTQ